MGRLSRAWVEKVKEALKAGEMKEWRNGRVEGGTDV